MRYDIYGRDVMIANKMESNGKAGRIMVSETTKNLLERNSNPDLEYEFEFHKEVDVSNAHQKQIIKGYLVKDHFEEEQ